MNASPKPSMTIRIGAAHWDATMADGTNFDFASMTSAQRKEWYGHFGDAVWAIYGKNDRRRGRPLPHPRRGGRRQ